MKFFFKLGTITVLLIILLKVDVLANLYVDASNGSNTNSGTQPDNALKTIQSAFNKVLAGDTIFIREGTYTEASIFNKFNNGNGSQEAPIVIKNYLNEQAIIDGTNYTFGTDFNDPKGMMDIRGKSYITISGLNFKDSKQYALWINHEGSYNSSQINISDIVVESTTDNAINMRNTQNITLKNITIYDSSGAGIYLKACTSINIMNCVTEKTASSGIGAWKCSQLSIINNEIIDARYVGGGGEECLTISGTNQFQVINNKVFTKNFNLSNLGIDAKDTCSFGTICKNYVYGTVNAGIYIDAYGYNGSSSVYSDTLKNIEIYQNWIDSCGRGIDIASEKGRPVSDIDIYNNIITKPGQEGIRISPHGEDEDVDNDGLSDGDGLKKNIRIYNNTIFEKYLHWCKGIHVGSNHIKNISIMNNLVMIPVTNGGQIYLRDPLSTEITTMNNMVWGEQKHPENEAQNSIVQDPLFNDTSTYDFHLLPSSPAIDKGYSVNLLFDYDDNARPIDGDNNSTAVIDMGAFEFPNLTSLKPSFKSINSEIINVYPNPIHDHFIVELAEQNPKTIVSVYDINGTLIKSRTYAHMKSLPMDLSVHRGIYVVKIDSKNNTQTMKIAVD